MERYGWNASIDQPYSDLFLVLRAGGAADRPPGRPLRYSPIARLLLAFDEGLVDAAREDMDQSVYRRKLVERAKPALLNKLR